MTRAGTASLLAGLAVVLALSACLTAKVEEPADTGAATCLPTYGDRCDCDPKCMTAAEIEAVNSGLVCDLGCPGEVDWTCERDEKGCRVADG